MTSRKVLLLLALIIISPEAFSWGKNGHRIVGEIAQRNLNSAAQKGVKALLGVDSLSRVSTYADEIRSNKKFDYIAPWHYVSIPSGKTYFDQKRPQEGDVIEALYRFEETLRDAKKSKEEKVEALKLMVHMMGDVHQPLHVGLAEDRGGNNVRVKWFKNESNLHAIWDEFIVDFEQLSYSEYATYLNHFTPAEKKDFAKGSFLDWATESQELRSIVYDTGGIESLGYDYHAKVKPTMELRLRQAGFRLSNVLNKIFTKSPLDKDYVTISQKIKDNK